LFARTRENVTHSADRLDVLVGVGIAEFLADLADVHVDAAVKGRKLAAEHGVHQTFAWDHAPSLPQQHFQQVKLNRGKVDGLTVTAHAARGWIEFDLAYAD